MASDKKRCACPTKGGGHKYVWNCDTYNSCTDCCIGEGETGGVTSVGGTGRPVTWRRQSGETTSSGGQILGLTTQQALVAVGIGVAAYFIIKKVK